MRCAPRSRFSTWSSFPPYNFSKSALIFAANCSSAEGVTVSDSVTSTSTDPSPSLGFGSVSSISTTGSSSTTPGVSFFGITSSCSRQPTTLSKMSSPPLQLSQHHVEFPSGLLQPIRHPLLVGGTLPLTQGSRFPRLAALHQPLPAGFEERPRRALGQLAELTGLLRSEFLHLQRHSTLLLEITPSASATRP